jgi:hypothetical protein
MKYVVKIIRRFCKSWYFSSHKSSVKYLLHLSGHFNEIFV